MAVRVPLVAHPGKLRPAPETRGLDLELGQDPPPAFGHRDLDLFDHLTRQSTLQAARHGGGGRGRDGEGDGDRVWVKLPRYDPSRWLQ